MSVDSFNLVAAPEIVSIINFSGSASKFLFNSLVVMTSNTIYVWAGGWVSNTYVYVQGIITSVQITT